jgi:predicted DNA-binding protein
MPTSKKRINLSVDDELYGELERLQELKKAPSLSAVVLELTKEALELQEDLYFAKIAEERMKESTVSHKKVWKKK